jgi:hypothetical protein
MELERQQRDRRKRITELHDLLRDITSVVCEASDDATIIVGHLEPLILKLFAFFCMLYALSKLMG